MNTYGYDMLGTNIVALSKTAVAHPRLVALAGHGVSLCLWCYLRCAGRALAEYLVLTALAAAFLPLPGSPPVQLSDQGLPGRWNR